MIGPCRAVAASPQTSDQSAMALWPLGRALRASGADTEAVTLFCRAQQQHPNDFWVNLNLAGALTDPSQLDESLRFYTAVVALRPQSTAAQNILGCALY